MAKKILIVEDNELNMKLMSDVLSEVGYDITEAENGEIALNLIEKQDFDLILLDIQLPQKSGYDVLKEMRKEIPTIAVSACCMEDEIIKAKASGCLDYIKKPLNINEFIAKIKQYLK